MKLGLSGYMIGLVCLSLCLYVRNTLALTKFGTVVCGEDLRGLRFGNSGFRNGNLLSGCKFPPEYFCLLLDVKLCMIL